MVLRWDGKNANGYLKMLKQIVLFLVYLACAEKHVESAHDQMKMGYKISEEEDIEIKELASVSFEKLSFVTDCICMCEEPL